MIPRAGLEDLVREGGAMGLRHFGKCAASRKPDRSFVTEADMAIEEAIRRRVRAEYPDVGLVGEEMASVDAEAPFTLAIDPIDGTASFVAGLPTWCVSIGLMHEGTPLSGAIYLPAVNELYSADEASAYFMGQPLGRPEPWEGDPQAFILVHSTTHHHFQVTWPAKLRNLGSTAYHMALVARGSAVAALLGKPGVWDLAAGAALLERVGVGLFGIESGEPLSFPTIRAGGYPPEPLLAVRPEWLDIIRPHFQPVDGVVLGFDKLGGAG